MVLNEKQKKILFVILENGVMPSSNVHATLLKSGEKISLVTVKRALSEMAESELLAVFGSGPSTSYGASAPGRLFAPVDARGYCSTEPDKRYGLNRYNFDLFSAAPPEIF
ncbi:hypothetical protein KJ575_00810, partial [Patescibacteria group bacterium]|nr:hypothetical protein [Patescibacteria group bacterium]